MLGFKASGRVFGFGGGGGGVWWVCGSRFNPLSKRCKLVSFALGPGSGLDPGDNESSMRRPGKKKWRRRNERLDEGLWQQLQLQVCSEVQWMRCRVYVGSIGGVM